MYNFLGPVLIFILLLCLAILALTIPRWGKTLAFFLNIASSVFLGLALVIWNFDELNLTELFNMNRHQANVVAIASLFNVLVGLLNGGKTSSNVRASILSSFMLLGGLFLIGSTEFITFFVALELIALMNYAQMALSKLENAKEAAIKYFIQGSVFTAFFLLGMAFFLAATGGFNFLDFNIANPELYVMAVALLFLVVCFKMGAFPFHSWMPDVYSNVDLGNLASNFLLTKFLIGYGFISILLRLVNESGTYYYSYLLAGILLVSIISAVYGNIIGLAQGQYKRIIGYSSLAHTGYMLMTLCVPMDEGYEKQLLFYLTFYSLAATGTVLLINRFIQQNPHGNVQNALKGGFYRDGLGALLLSIFILALGGMPLTSGFTTKYLLFSNYFREGLTLQAIVVLISSVIGLGYYIKFIIDLFLEFPEEKDHSRADITATNTGTLLVQNDINAFLIPIFLAFLVILGGVVPSYFLGRP